MSKQKKTYVDRDGREYQYGEMNLEGRLFWRISPQGSAIFITQKSYDRMNETKRKRKAIRKSEKNIFTQKCITMGDSRTSLGIRKQILELHARGKDYSTIAIRLGKPVSTVKIVCETLGGK